MYRDTTNVEHKMYDYRKVDTRIMPPISFFSETIITTVKKSPYIPDLAPSDSHLFGPLKYSVRE
jgi:hypothetical protein